MHVMPTTRHSLLSHQCGCSNYSTKSMSQVLLKVNLSYQILFSHTQYMIGLHFIISDVTEEILWKPHGAYDEDHLMKPEILSFYISTSQYKKIILMIIGDVQDDTILRVNSNHVEEVRNLKHHGSLKSSDGDWSRGVNIAMAKQKTSDLTTLLKDRSIPVALETKRGSNA